MGKLVVFIGLVWVVYDIGMGFCFVGVCVAFGWVFVFFFGFYGGFWFVRDFLGLGFWGLGGGGGLGCCYGVLLFFGGWVVVWVNCFLVVYVVFCVWVCVFLFW